MPIETPLAHQIGFDGFIWFIGVIESVADDMLRIGRAKVRIIGWHEPDTDKLPTVNLPWAYPILPVTGTMSTPNYRPGDWVVGFFLDGKLGQQPLIFGCLPSIPQKSV